MNRWILAGVVALAFTPVGGNELKLGDKIPSSKFGEVLLNWDGAEGIGDYAGEPLLVDFWGTH